MGPSNTAS
jgi:hypothetical protein